jgi:hypothetical protein
LQKVKIGAAMVNDNWKMHITCASKSPL